MLYTFLLEHREDILALCAKKLNDSGGKLSLNEELELGLPIFYTELIEVLRADDGRVSTAEDMNINSVHHESAVRSGRESLRLGYTISQVVHGYGALCQAITEYAGGHKKAPILAREFNRLNFSLDTVIAEAVTEYSRGQRAEAARGEVLRLGFLAHELRNALGNAAAAQQLIKKGIVGFGGSTSRVLEDSLTRMKDIIDRSISEVRLSSEPTINCQQCRVVDLVSAVEVIGRIEAALKSIVFIVEVSPELIIDVDIHLLMSAISNLVQNAIKFTKVNGTISIRGRSLGERVLIDIEDECGGLAPGKLEEMFLPFSRIGENKTGMGLGLSISQRAVTLNKGLLTVANLPGKGCIFTIDLPRALVV